MKKKLVMILLCGVLLVGITGCGTDKKENKDNNKDQNNNNQNNKPKPKPQKPEGISQQAADRILKRSADKEKETRKRSVYGRQQGQGNDPFSAPKRGKRW